MTTSDRDAGLPRPRAVVRGLPLYAPDVAACTVDVSDNANLWGTPPASLRALASAPAERVTRYPSLYSTPLREAVLRYLGLSSANGIGLVTGCGSDDVLDAAIRAFGEPGDEVAFAAPTFVMIPIFARLNGLVPAVVPLGPNYEVDPQRWWIGARRSPTCARRTTRRRRRCRARRWNASWSARRGWSSSTRRTRSSRRTSSRPS